MAPLTKIALITLIIVPLPRIASPQDVWIAQVDTQLTNIAEAAGTEGMSLVRDVVRGALKQGETYRMSLTLEGRKNHLVTAVCDVDCTALYLRVLNEEDRELVRSAVPGDDTPLVEIVPEYRHPFTIEVTMAECESEPCRFGVGVYTE